MSIRNDIEPDLLRKLSTLKTVPGRHPEREEQGLEAFIREAAELTPAITPQRKRRHTIWMHALQSIFTGQRKEHSPMFSTLMSVFLIVSLVLGGGGATVAAAQNSQPDQPLYGVKLLSEDVRIQLSAKSEQEIQLALEFADRRAAEITTMLQNGSLPSQAVQSRYQNQIEQMFQTALNLSGSQAPQALAQIQAHLKQQEQAFMQIQVNGSLDITAVKARIELMLQERIQWAETGQADPAQLRERLRMRDQQQDQIRQRTATPENQGTRTSPGTGSGNPWSTGTPTPGSGYGPGQGSGNCGSCTPTQEGQGGNPWTTGTPTPGSGYGPGPGPAATQTCTPVGNNGSGPQPTQMRTNQPTQPTAQQQNQPTQAGPQPTQQQNQPTQAGPLPTQQQQNQPTQAGPQPTGGPGNKR